MPLAGLIFSNYFSPPFWDHPPFACFLKQSAVCSQFPDCLPAVQPVICKFLDPDDLTVTKHNLQKCLAAKIKPIIVPNTVICDLVRKASLQKIVVTHPQLKAYLKDVSRLPLIISATFIKVLCNALCTTARIKNSPTLKCFACGKGRDDLFHFLRCPRFGFIFNLPPAFGNIHFKYFDSNVLARVAVAFEVYYILTRQFASKLGKLSYHALACLASDRARLVAIKDNIQHLARLRTLHASDVVEFIENRKNACKSGVLDLGVI